MTKISGEEFVGMFAWVTDVTSRIDDAGLGDLTDEECEMLWDVYKAGSKPEDGYNFIQSKRSEEKNGRIQ